MIKISEQAIFLVSHEGDAQPFDVAELQTDLIRCFLSTGFRENSYLAEDIALAVEYALSHPDRPDHTFSSGDLIRTVVRILSDTGFGEVASLYRHGKMALEPEKINCTDAEALRRVLSQSEESAHGGVERSVAQALKNLKITQAAPELILELARYYRQLPPEEVQPSIAVNTPQRRQGTGLYFVTPEEVEQALPVDVQELLRANILRQNGVSRLHPSIRIYLKIQSFARLHQLTAPVTEMDIEPLLFGLAPQIDLCCRKTRELYAAGNNGEAKLPVYLHVPDMPGFVTDYLGGTWPKGRKIANELADVLTRALETEIYKTSIE